MIQWVMKEVGDADAADAAQCQREVFVLLAFFKVTPCFAVFSCAKFISRK